MKKDHLLRRDVEVHQVFSIFASVALNLLPFLASDYPEDDKSVFYKVFCQWNLMKERVVEAMLSNFCRGDETLTTVEFITRGALLPQYFDTLGIRDEAKR